MTCPLEKQMETLLLKHDIAFTRPEKAGRNLDFYLTNYGLAVEIKQFHSDRVNKQIKDSGFPTVMVLIGRESVNVLAELLAREPMHLSD